jgi:hypothetical protein
MIRQFSATVNNGDISDIRYCKDYASEHGRERSREESRQESREASI